MRHGKKSGGDLVGELPVLVMSNKGHVTKGVAMKDSVRVFDSGGTGAVIGRSLLVRWGLGVATILLAIALPASAFAYVNANSGQYSWTVGSTTQGGVFHRMPSVESSDVRATAGRTVFVTGDATGNSCSSAFGYRFRENKNLMPDVTKVTLDRRSYCDGMHRTQSLVAAGGVYYFDAMVLVAPSAASTITVSWGK